MNEFGMKPIKFMSGKKNYGYNQDIIMENETEEISMILDFDTNEINRNITLKDRENFSNKLGSMCYYIKLDHLKSRETSEEYDFRMLYGKELEYISWDKLQDIILFNTGNKERINMEQKKYKEITEPPNFYEICNSQIGFKKETFFICNVIGDNHYYREQTTNDLVVQYFKKVDNDLNLHCDFINENQDKPTEAFKTIRKQYWGHKLQYLTKNINGTNEMFVDMRTL